MAAPLDAATVDLLGVLAYGELTAFERLASDARLAPTVADKTALATMASAEFGHFQRLREHLRAGGVDPDAAMAPFVAPLDAFHDSTEPNDWLEGLIKAYVGDGLAADFYREVAGSLQDAQTRELVLEVLADTGQAEFAVARVQRGDRRAAGGGRAPRPVGAAADGRGAHPGPAGRRRPRRAHRAARRRRATSPASSPCSTGSPTGTPPGWPRIGLTA